MKYTKGEWKQTGSIIWASGKEGAVICQMAEPHPTSCLVEYQPLKINSEGWNLQMSNAHLIATAPQLYEALKDLMEALEECGSEHNAVGVAYNLAKPVLAKAEGK